jgi:CheY-like chemotaxis protein
VNDGRQAVDRLARETFDVVLMDVQMPELNGFEATAEIRRNERYTGRHQFIAAMTAHALKGDRERCLDGGMDSYISKPIDRDALVAVLAEAVAHVDRRDLVAATWVSGLRLQASAAKASEPEAAEARSLRPEAFS